jgi:hypothetical protein
MMSSRVMFGEIITQVVGALAPVHTKLLLTDPILDPAIEAHFHGFGFAFGVRCRWLSRWRKNCRSASVPAVEDGPS